MQMFDRMLLGTLLGLVVTLGFLMGSIHRETMDAIDRNTAACVAR